MGQESGRGLLGHLGLDVSQSCNQNVSLGFCSHEINFQGLLPCLSEGPTPPGLLTWTSSGLLLWHGTWVPLYSQSRSSRLLQLAWSKTGSEVASHPSVLNSADRNENLHPKVGSYTRVWIRESGVFGDL